MVGAVPVCPPERPRSGVSIRKGHIPYPQRRRFHPQKSTSPIHKGGVSIGKGHIPSRKGGVFMRRNVCALRMMHTCYRWMRPCRATRAGTQAPPLPTSIKPLCHATSLILVHRRAPRRQPFFDLVHRQAPRRQPQSGMTAVSQPRPNKFVQTRAFC